VRTLVLAAASLVTLAALIQLFTYRETIQDGEEREFGPVNVLSLSESVMHQVEGDALRMQVWAERTVYAEERQRARLFGVRFTAYPKPEQNVPQEPVHGNARDAIVLGSRSVIELEGAVHIYQGGTLELRGEQVRYDYRRGLISSKVPVWVRNGPTVQQGDSAEYSLPDETLHITRPLVWE
jgi:hypothetical protein